MAEPEPVTGANAADPGLCSARGRVSMSEDAPGSAAESGCEFERTIRARDGGRCVVCAEAGTSIHCLFDPRLWDDGVSPIDNAVLLCVEHQLQAARDDITPESLREAAGLAPCLPPQLYAVQRYDRWGNPILSCGGRAKGELFNLPDVQRQLEECGKLELATDWVKYPRTYVLPWSESMGEGDRRMISDEAFSGRRVIATEKMDGVNITLYRNFFHSRSIATNTHSSRRWVQDFWEEIREAIPPGWRICGEYLYAAHTVRYTDLPSFFLGFSVWDSRNLCLGWDDTVRFLDDIGLATVPVMFDGIFDRDAIAAAWRARNRVESEGYILRVSDAFEYGSFRKHSGKFIRDGYRQSDPILDNILSGTAIETNEVNPFRSPRPADTP